MGHSTGAAQTGRRVSGRAQQDGILDPYHEQHKLAEPTVCPQCAAVYHRGRWAWRPGPEGAHHALCPACRRVNYALPAGLVTLRCAGRLRDKVAGLIRNEEAAEKAEHPLNRVIAVNETADGLVVQTTDIHLPRRIGTAVKRAYRGELDVHFDDAAYFVRVDWTAPG